MIYAQRSAESAIDQGDIVEECPHIFLIDYQQLHTVRLELLTTLSRQGKCPARLLPPYREHLAKHFADTYGRIGLPEPYETEP
jgi:hypothetical protein